MFRPESTQSEEVRSEDAEWYVVNAPDGNSKGFSAWFV